jgi:hypothetical protein
MLCVCIGCGARKAGHLRKCSRCGLKPHTTEQVAKSLYLSNGVFAPEERAQSPELVPSEYTDEQLLAIRSNIARGNEHHYDHMRLGQLMNQAAAISNANRKQAFLWLLKLWLPILIVLALAIALRMLNSHDAAR